MVDLFMSIFTSRRKEEVRGCVASEERIMCVSIFRRI
jgi:hypothetical protein